MKIEELRISDIISCLYEATRRDIDVIPTLRELGVTHIPLFFNEAWRLQINIGVSYGFKTNGQDELWRITPDLIKMNYREVYCNNIVIGLWAANLEEATFLRAGLFPKKTNHHNTLEAFYFEENDALPLAAMQSIQQKLG